MNISCPLVLHKLESEELYEYMSACNVLGFIDGELAGHIWESRPSVMEMEI
jgi:hypothetical protein